MEDEDEGRHGKVDVGVDGYEQSRNTGLQKQLLFISPTPSLRIELFESFMVLS